MITYTWKAKKLREDDFGYASTLVLSMEAQKNDEIKRESISISFGGSDLKSIDEWTQEEIDAVAESHRITMEESLTNQFSLEN